ncbi:MAG: type I-B CRISPR-associated protein Cas8b1/Cst1, partial [Patescibacteria group bacterium]
HEKATEKVSTEYHKYKAKNLSEVEKSYLEAIKIVGEKIEKKVKEKFAKSKK